jgi:hypothetical protein
MAKKYEYLVIHCLDTPQGRDVSGADVIRWHTTPKPKGRGWDRAGYSDIIHLDGRIENITPYNDDDIIEAHEKTWGARGVNSISRHVALVGGRGKKGVHEKYNYLTYKQKKSLQSYIKKELELHPNVKIAGHYCFSKTKTCPNFNVETFCFDIGVDEDNIVFTDRILPFIAIIDY